MSNMVLGHLKGNYLMPTKEVTLLSSNRDLLSPPSSLFSLDIWPHLHSWGLMGTKFVQTPCAITFSRKFVHHSRLRCLTESQYFDLYFSQLSDLNKFPTSICGQEEVNINENPWDSSVIHPSWQKAYSRLQLIFLSVNTKRRCVGH